MKTIIDNIIQNLEKAKKFIVDDEKYSTKITDIILELGNMSSALVIALDSPNSKLADKEKTERRYFAC